MTKKLLMAHNSCLFFSSMQSEAQIREEKVAT
jgi:hypothetical protein